MAVLFDSRGAFVIAQSNVFLVPSLGLCSESRGKGTRYPGLCQRVHLPSRWITLAFLRINATILHYGVVKSPRTKKMFITAQFGQCYPKKGGR